MSVETGFDYSPVVQGLLTLPQAHAFAAAGLERCALALDTSAQSLQSARNLAAAGIALDAYRELDAYYGSYSAQIQDVLKAFSLLSPQGVTFRRLWLTAEDLSFDDPVAWLAAFRSAVQMVSAYDAGLYTGAWFWRDTMGNPTDFAHLPLWDADYDGLAALGQVSYGGWAGAKPAAKQYASPVTVAGVSLDLDVFAS